MEKDRRYDREEDEDRLFHQLFSSPCLSLSCLNPFSYFTYFLFSLLPDYLLFSLFTILTIHSFPLFLITSFLYFLSYSFPLFIYFLVYFISHLRPMLYNSIFSRTKYNMYPLSSGLCKDCMVQRVRCENYKSPKPPGCPEDVRSDKKIKYRFNSCLIQMYDTDV